MTQDPSHDDALRRQIAEALVPDDLRTDSPQKIESLLADGDHPPLAEARIAYIFDRTSIRNESMNQSRPTIAAASSLPSAAAQPIPTGSYLVVGVIAAALLIVVGYLLGIGNGAGNGGTHKNDSPVAGQQSVPEVKLVANTDLLSSGLMPRPHEPGAAPVSVAVGRCDRNAKGPTAACCAARWFDPLCQRADLTTRRSAAPHPTLGKAKSSRRLFPLPRRSKNKPAAAL